MSWRSALLSLWNKPYFRKYKRLDSETFVKKGWDEKTSCCWAENQKENQEFSVNQLLFLPPVETFEIDLPKKLVWIESDKDVEVLTEALKKSGKEVKYIGNKWRDVQNSGGGRFSSWALFVVFVLCKITSAADVKLRCLQLDPGSPRHPSAHIPTKGCRSWFRRCRMMVWEVKPPPAAVVKPISADCAASVSSRDHSTQQLSEILWF